MVFNILMFTLFSLILLVAKSNVLLLLWLFLSVLFAFKFTLTDTKGYNTLQFQGSLNKYTASENWTAKFLKL